MAQEQLDIRIDEVIDRPRALLHRVLRAIKGATVELLVAEGGADAEIFDEAGDPLTGPFFTNKDGRVRHTDAADIFAEQTSVIWVDARKGAKHWTFWHHVPDPRGGPSSGRNLPLVEVVGHSQNDGADLLGEKKEQRWTSKVARALDAHERNIAVGGAVLAQEQSALVGYAAGDDGGYAWVLNQITRPVAGKPYVPRSNLVFVHYGLNDISYGMDLVVPVQEAHRAVICRFRAASVNENDDASCAYSAGWATYPYTLGGKTLGSGTGFHQSDGTAGRTVTITVPADFRGGEIDLGFIVGPGAEAVVSVAVDGGAPTVKTLDATLYDDARGKRNAAIHRITGLAAGAHTIVATVTSGVLVFDYWQIAAENPPRILVCLPYPLYSYTPVYTGRPNVPDDADVATLAAALEVVVGEFDDAVIASDIGRYVPAHTNPENWTPLEDHPSERGHYLLAKAALEDVLKRPPSDDNIVEHAAVPGLPGRATWWVTPTFQNSWTDYGSAGFQPVGYRRTYDGEVELKGYVRGGANLTDVILTLPRDYRPMFDMDFPCLIPSSVGGMAHVRVGRDGTVKIVQDFENFPDLYHLIHSAAGTRLDAATTAASPFPAVSHAAANPASIFWSLSRLIFDPARYLSFPSRTVRGLVVASFVTNATAPGASCVFKAGLYSLAPAGGAAATVTETPSLVAGTQTGAVTGPGASTRSGQQSAVFDAPAAGDYALGIALTGANMAANSAVACAAKLMVTQEVSAANVIAAGVCLDGIRFAAEAD